MQDTLLAKVEIIKHCLRRIAGATEINPEKLEDYNIQDVFVLNLQRGIQAAIDIASLLIAHYNWHMPSTYKALFEVLQQQEVIDSELSLHLQRMVGFRNIAIHDYRKIEIPILKSILIERLVDLQEYYQIVLKFIEKKSG